MTTVEATYDSMRRKSYPLTSTNDETPQIPMSAGSTALIHVSGATGSTWCVYVYVTGNPTPVKADYNGVTDFTKDMVMPCRVTGECFISVKLLVDGGSLTATITKEV